LILTYAAVASARMRSLPYLRLLIKKIFFAVL